MKLKCVLCTLDNAIASGLVSLLRYSEKKQPVEHMDLLCATASLILFGGGAEYESRKSF